jgi:N utilization substance protein B
VSEPPGPHRTARRKARKYALDVLFAADLQEVDPMSIVAQGLVTNQEELPAYSVELVEGVTDHLAELDQAIAAHLKEGWTVARMPRVDRQLARLAVFEATHLSTPAEVAVGEAVALAAELSTDDSPAFLAGLLNAVLKAAVTPAATASA